MNTTYHIRRAVFLVGSQSALARKLGIKPQAVQRWCSTGVVPAKRVIDIERITEGAVTRYELRPDLYPERPDGYSVAQPIEMANRIEGGAA